jgi:hypothetical protein
MVFIGTDPIIDVPMLTNAGVFTMFYSKFDPYKISNLLGVSKDTYDQMLSLLKAKPDERRCLVSVNKNITLIKTDPFEINASGETVVDILKDKPVQVQLRERYTQNSFDLMS